MAAGVMGGARCLSGPPSQQRGGAGMWRARVARSVIVRREDPHNSIDFLSNKTRKSCYDVFKNKLQSLVPGVNRTPVFYFYSQFYIFILSFKYIISYNVCSWLSNPNINEYI